MASCREKAWNNWNMYACLVGCWGKCSKNAMHSSQAALFGHKLQYVAWDSDTISPTFKKGLSEADLPLWKVAILQWIRKFVRHSEIVLDTAIEKFAESGLDPNSWWYICIYMYIMFVNLNIHRYQISMIFISALESMSDLTEFLHKIYKIQF